MKTQTTYDETPYPSSSFPQTNPNRLAAIARLFGVDAKAPSNARVLELGCADGANLLPMADRTPGASYLGIDASKVQIAAGMRAIEMTGLKNVEIRVQDILDFSATEGKFDYIIAHGIFSWVPEPVREKMLAICREHLTDHGIAYISYNALPGWNMRRLLRDMMLFHTRNFTDPKIKVGQSRALLKFLSDSVPSGRDAYGQLLRDELKNLSEQEDNYLRHDFLEEDNVAFYFHEFVARADRHGLQYLGEPNLAPMLVDNFSKNVSQTLRDVGKNIIDQEQYMDFLRNRMFRQTLLCRKGLPLSRTFGADRIRQFAFQSLYKPLDGGVDLTAGVAVSFAASRGQSVTASEVFLKAVLQELVQGGPRVISYARLLDSAANAARPYLGTPAANQTQINDAALAGNLAHLIGKGFIEIHVEPVDFATTEPKRPALTPLMHYQAINARLITSRVHQAILADNSIRAVVDLCDGVRTKEEIVEALVACVKDGSHNVWESGQLITDEAKIRVLFAQRVRMVLAQLTQKGFFAP